MVSVDYRRPPEVRFPGAFEDAFAAVRDVFERIAEFGGDDSRVGVAGDSAGGNLAATVAIGCRDAGIGLAACRAAHLLDVSSWRERTFARISRNRQVRRGFERNAVAP